MNKLAYKHKKIIKNIFIVAIITYINTALCGCTRNQEPISASAVFFDTFITINIYDSNNEDLLNECLNICQNYENMFSTTIVDSDIYKINNSQGQITYVNPETLELISDSISYSEMTSGKYDITVYSDSMLWDFHSPDNPIPDDKLIKESLNHINYKNIIIDRESSTITMLDSNCKIDLGSIAKGFIADKIYDYLYSSNVKSAVINMGGDIRIVGQKPTAQPFNIGIQDPNSKNSIITSLKLTDCSVATSGTYERYIINNGQKLHHILDPHTGYPVSTDIDSVTVVTTSAETADALCTSVILLGKDAALPFLESFENTEAIIVTNDKTVYKTSGMNKYIY